MPIYEYKCKKCGRKMSFLVFTLKKVKELECKHCRSQELERLISRFATVRSEESRLESMADPSKFAGLDEKDPKSIAKWMKRMGNEMGEDIGGNIDQAVDEAMEESAGGGGESSSEDL